MPSKTCKQSSKASMSPRGWTCCKCLTPNSDGRQICDGVLPFESIYGRACDHWHCPSCRPLDDGKSTQILNLTTTNSQIETLGRPSRADSDGNSMPTSPSSMAKTYPPTNTRGYHTSPSHHQLPPDHPSLHLPGLPPLPPSPHTRFHHHFPPHPSNDPYVYHHHYRHHHHHQQQHKSPQLHTTPEPPRFSYTAAYLQSAASRGTNTVTFAEAFPPPEAADWEAPVMALAGLRLDYSARGSSRASSGGPDGDLGGDGTVGGEDGDEDCGRVPGRTRVDEADGDGEHDDGGGGVATSSSSSGGHKRKRKAGMERESVTRGVRRGSGRTDKGKGKARCVWGEPRHPGGYRPVSVEDELDAESEGGHGYKYGYGDGPEKGNGDEMEEEW